MKVLALRRSIYRSPLILLLPLVIILLSIATYRAVKRAPLEATQLEAGSVWKLKPGDRLIYELKYESDSFSDLQALYGSVGAGAERGAQGVFPHVYRVTVEATAVLTALERTGSIILASYRFPHARINAESEMGNLIDTDRVQLELARDTFCEIAEDGRIRSLVLDSTNCGATNNFARTLLGLTQFARNEGSGAEHWETEEDDSSGNYRAQYDLIVPTDPSLARQEQTGARTFRKTKLEYFDSVSDDDREMPQAPRTILPEASFEVTFDFDKGRIETVAGVEAQTILIAGRIVGGAQNKFQLKLLSEDKASQAEVASAVEGHARRSNLTQPIALSASPSERAQVAAMYTLQLGEDSLQTVKTALDAIERGSSNVDYSQLYSKTKALIFLHPDVCAELGIVLRHADPAGHAARLVAEALAAVGNTEAQEALIDSIRARRNDAAIVVPLLIALGGVKRPSQTAQDAVEEMAWRTPGTAVARAAQLELGSIAHNLRARSPRRAAQIVENATARLSDVPGAESDLIALLGNSGVTEALPVVTRFLDHPSPELRGEAALALRFIVGEPVDEKLARVMTSDRDESVRLQAATAFEFRNITQTTLEAQRAALRSDASASVRMRVMTNLWRNHDDYPEVLALIERVAMNDPSKEVRAAATRLVASR